MGIGLRPTVGYFTPTNVNLVENVKKKQVWNLSLDKLHIKSTTINYTPYPLCILHIAQSKQMRVSLRASLAFVHGTHWQWSPCAQPQHPKRMKICWGTKKKREEKRTHNCAICTVLRRESTENENKKNALIFCPRREEANGTELESPGWWGVSYRTGTISFFCNVLRGCHVSLIHTMYYTYI